MNLKVFMCDQVFACVVLCLLLSVWIPTFVWMSVGKYVCVSAYLFFNYLD